MNQTGTHISFDRNYGIDLLRLVAAFYIVVLHTLGIGGVFEATTPGSYQNSICRLLIIVTFSAVNIFGIISGYVGYRESERKISFSGYLPIWLTVVLYCVFFTGIFRFFLPDAITSKDLAASFFPVTNNLYWYFSSYTFVYFLSPFLNKILRYSSKTELNLLFFLICCVFVFLEYLDEPFNMLGGYSAIWLLLLYLIGGIIKKQQIGRNMPTYTIFIAILLINIIFYYLSASKSALTFGIFTFNFDIFYSYVHPFYFAAAILHVILFSRFTFPTPVNRIIRFVAPATFSIYILNTNKLLWNNFIRREFMRNYLASWATSSPAGLFARTMLFSFSFVTAVVIIDFFRQKLFQLLGVQNWTKKLSRTIHKIKQMQS